MYEEALNLTGEWRINNGIKNIKIKIVIKINKKNQNKKNIPKNLHIRGGNTNAIFKSHFSKFYKSKNFSA